MNIKYNFKPHARRLLDFYHRRKRLCLITLGFLAIILGVWAFSKLSEPEKHVYHTKNSTSFEGSRILGSAKEVYERQSNLFDGRLKAVEGAQRDIKATLETINRKLDTPKPMVAPSPQPLPSPEATPVDSEGKSTSILTSKPQQVLPSESALTTEQVEPAPQKIGTGRLQPGLTRRLPMPTREIKGPPIISFPVDAKSQAQELGVKLPVGSFVRAKMLTGVEAPEGKALPVLLQADYAFIGPNKTRIDLAGCFLIAKSSGNLSIERVEMQATKMSCVSKNGRMFERDINGFIADDKDNSFAVAGSVNSKQDRVAAMAFLSSIVEGVGKAIQQAQTTTQTGKDGTSTTTVTEDQGKYIAAGGATNAAALVTQWYLKQAESLLPTINVGSGQDVWLIMQETASLPNWYFRKTDDQRSSANAYLYLSRLAD